MTELNMIEYKQNFIVKPMLQWLIVTVLWLLFLLLPSEAQGSLSFYVVVTLVLLIISALDMRKSRVPFMLIHLVFFYFMVGISPIVGYFMYRNKPSVVTSQWVLIGVAAYFTAYLAIPYLDKSKNKKQILPQNPYVKWLCGFLILALSVVCDLINLIRSIEIYASGVFDNTRITAMQGNGVLLLLASLSIWGAGYIIELDFRGYRKHRKLWIPLLVAAIVLRATTGFRMYVLTFPAVFLIMYIRNRKIPVVRTALISVACLVFLAMYGNFRSSGAEKNVLEEAFHISTVSFNTISRLLTNFPYRIDFTHGYYYLLNVIQIRPGPDPDATVWLKQVLGMTFNGGGLTPTIIGEFYINFGFFGIVAGMALYGAFSKLVVRSYEKGHLLFLSSNVMVNIFRSYRDGISSSLISHIVIPGMVYFVVLKTMCFLADRSKSKGTRRGRPVTVLGGEHNEV